MIKKLLKYFFIVLACIGLFIFIANRSITSYTKEFITNDLVKVGNCKTALLLGTSKKLKGGYKNYYFYNRIAATIELYKAGKIKYIIVSGDNSLKEYNEPMDMKKELVKNGIPDSVIYLDYAGFRTLDSVIRAREIFGQDTFIVVSQEFHNQRAVYIARKKGIKAYGYNAKDVDARHGFKTNLREVFARVKVFFDLWLGKSPKFLGDKIEIK